MAWNNDPAVRALGVFCNEHGLAIGILFGLKDDGHTVEVITYGKTAELCRVAKGMGDQVWDLIEEGAISPESSGD